MARYKDAIWWLARNDDNDWLADPDGHLSVCAALVANMFGKEDAKVVADLRKEVVRMDEENALRKAANVK